MLVGSLRSSDVTTMSSASNNITIIIINTHVTAIINVTINIIIIITKNSIITGVNTNNHTTTINNINISAVVGCGPFDPVSSTSATH